MDRVFLDANILVSAARKPVSGLLRLWNIKNAQLITSDYALQEAIVNLETPEQQERLHELIKNVNVIQSVENIPLPDTIRLPEKDRPILQAAIAAQATHLLTGDIKHFGEL